MPATARAPRSESPGTERTPAPPLTLVPPGPRRRVVSLRVVVPLASVLMLAAALLAGAFFWEDQSRRLLAREAGTRFVAETRQLALASAGALLEPFPELTLQPIVRDLLSGRGEILEAEVVDLNGTLVASAQPERLGKPYRHPAGLHPVEAPIRLRPDEQLLEDARRLVVVSPVIHSSGQRLGTATLTVRRDHLERALGEARRRVWGLLAFVLPLGGIATLLLIRHMLRPLASLRAGLERIGQGHLDTRIELRGHTEIGVLAETVNRMAGRLASARREALERERLQGEIDVAGRIQRLLLPTGGVELGRFRIAGNQVPAAQVGGDYFDVLPLSGDRVGLAVADVSGKGVGGCLVMAMLSALLRAFREAVASPSELLILLERHYPATLRREHFVTFWYAILDPVAGRVTFASAGHLPALVYRAHDRAVEWRKGRGVPLGALRGDALRRSLQDETIDLGPGDLLVQFTDGYSEAPRAGSLEEFGFERIGAAVREAAGLGPEGVLSRLREAVRQWSGTESPEDDQTLIVVGCLAGPVRAESSEVAACPGGPEDLQLLIERGRSEGRCLEFRIAPERLAELRGWLAATPELRDLGEDVLPLVEAALYEACANVMEHGYRGRPEGRFDLWWVPGTADACAPSTVADPRDRVRRGCFVIRDDGAPFDPATWPSPDLTDRRVRRRGRGFGVEMIRRIMSGVTSYPGTSLGNITIMRFDPWRSAGS